MKLSPRRFPLPCGLRALFVAYLVLTLGSSSAQEPENDEEPILVPAGGMEIFRYELLRAKIEPIENFSDLYENPRNVMIVLLGRESIDRFANNKFGVFNAVQQGASILIAADSTPLNDEFAQRFGVQILGDTVFAARADCYRGKPEDPYVRPFGRWRGFFNNDKASPQTIFRNLDASGAGALATNIASVLRIEEDGLLKPKPIPLAGYPFSAKVRFGFQRGGRDLDPNKDLFAASGRLRDGRFLVLADHSVFVNGMVWKEDNANLFFTRDCISWLQGEEQKSRCLFIEDGKIRTKFDLPRKEPSDLETALKLMEFIERNGNTIITEAQDRDLFNQFLLARFSMRDIIRCVLLLFSGFVFICGFRMLLRNRSKPDPARTLATPELAAMIPRGHVLKQRFESLLDAGNVHEAARQVVREFFAGLEAEPDAEGRPPRLVIEDGYEDEAGLRRRILRLWRIGYGSEPVKVRPEEWPGLTNDLQEILRDADDGWWKFVPIV